nr:formyltransferase family protein [uncultured Fluviicola sp.]
MEKLKTVIICGGKTAFESVHLLALEGNLAGVVIGGKDLESARQLKEFANGSDIPFLSVRSGKDLPQMKEWIKDVQPGYIFSINFPFIISENLLELLPNKWFNFHMGPLPSYRGAMPIFEVLKAQEKETAIAVHKMVSDADEGPVVFQETVQIDKNETFGSLAIKLRERTSLAVQSLVQMLEFGTNIPLIEQDETLAEYFPMPEIEETRIIWENMNAQEIVSLVNACNPWNFGADVMFHQPFKIISATAELKSHGAKAGTVLSMDTHSVKIACIDDSIVNTHIVKLESGVFQAGELNRLFIQTGSNLN